MLVPALSTILSAVSAVSKTFNAVGTAHQAYKYAKSGVPVRSSPRWIKKKSPVRRKKNKKLKRQLKNLRKVRP